MSSGPHQMNIGWREWTTMATADLRLCDQRDIGPRGVAAQSKRPIRAPISPPLATIQASGSVDAVCDVFILPDASRDRLRSGDGSSFAHRLSHRGPRWHEIEQAPD
jgi:hypothetical protein